jgi:hypothetical protein
MILENPLSKYASYNYRWKFGIVSPETLHNPALYRSKGPDKVIVQTGGSPNKDVTTFAEDALGVNVEYFLDDFDGQYLVTPNPKSSNSNSIQMSFKIYEPISVGLFFQSLRIACNETYGQNKGYLEVPFCLQLDFVGYDDAGTQLPAEAPHTLILKLINLTFDVTSSGSVYNITAIPWNHQAFMDQIQNTQTDIAIIGDTVEQMIAGQETRSLVSELNRQQIDYETRNQGAVGSRYRIEFPVDPSTSGQSPTLAFTSPAFYEDAILRQTGNRTFQSSEDLQRDLDRRRVSTPGFGDSIFGEFGPAVSSSPASSNSNSNYLGQSRIVQNFDDYGQNPFGVEQFIFEETAPEGDVSREIFRRGSLSIDPNNREFTFRQNTKIEKIISQVILSSDWGLSLINQLPDTNGNIEWFKIETETNIRDVGEILRSGLPAYEFVYKVTPYKIHASIVQPSSVAPDYSRALQNATKNYYYTYTGLNSDIIDFSFNIDNSFYKELGRATSQTGQDIQSDGGGGVATVEEQFSATNNVTGTATTEITDSGTPTRTVATSNSSSNSGNLSSKRQIADIFQTAILNSDTDMITLDLKIWGDPYYFMDSGIGNYITPSSAPGVTIDSRIDAARSEVFILIHFKTGVDYNGNLLNLDPVNAFSGLYKVVTFTNNFSKGMFTQTLNLMRMPNQSVETVETSNAIVQANRTGNLPLVIGNLQSEAAARTREFQSLLKEAEGLEKIATAFRSQGITQFDEILSGTQILDFAQNLFGAFDQMQNMQSNLTRTLGLLQGGIPGIAQTLLENSPTGGAIKNVTSIKNNISDIRTNLGRFGR